jgi:hypothetical protein
MVAQDAPEDMDPVAALKWALSGGEGLATAGASTKREKLLAIKKQHEEEEAAAGARTVVANLRFLSLRD